MSYLMRIKEVLERYGELTAEQIALFMEKETGQRINRSNLRARLYKYYTKGHIDRKIVKRPYGREYIYTLPQPNGHSFNTQEEQNKIMDGDANAENYDTN